MKTDIRHEGMWYSFKETCDRCGKLIQDHTIKRSHKPDTEEADFCIECLRYLIDNNILYTDAKKQYKSNT